MSEMKMAQSTSGNPMEDGVEENSPELDTRMERIRNAITILCNEKKPFIDLTTKFGFRRVFRLPGGSGDLIKVLNRWLPKGTLFIRKLTPFSLPEDAEQNGDWFKGFDFYGQDQLGRVITVELLDEPMTMDCLRKKLKAAQALQVSGGAKKKAARGPVKILNFQFLAYKRPGRGAKVTIQTLDMGGAAAKKSATNDEITLITIPLKNLNKYKTQLNKENDIQYLLQHMITFSTVPPYFEDKFFKGIIYRAEVGRLTFLDAFGYLGELIDKDDTLGRS